MLDLLFTPLKIGNLEIKNRLVVSPMVCNFCTAEGEATERFISYMAEKAKGGWGLIITENYAVTPEARGFSHMACIYDDKYIDSHRKMVSRVHEHGAKIIMQITHAGRQTNHLMNTGVQPIAPSAIPCPANQETPREMCVSEIKEIVSRFGDAARRAKAAGFDGVEIHGGHGYLLAEFMSPYSNKRVDEYGGVLMNRLRIIKEVIDDIRAKTSPDFLILFRISSMELMPGGRTIQDTMAITTVLEKWGVCAIDVSVGTYGDDSTIPSMAVSRAWNVDSAEEVKKAVKIPVMAVGRIYDPIVAEMVLASGKADLVVMGRGSLADPALPKKAQAGEFDKIRECIGCLQGCIGKLLAGFPIACLVNPQLGFEYQAIGKTDKPKRVCVAGGGPAGIEAARGAAMRGHDVTVFEQSDRLGGAFGVAAYPPYKGDIASYISWARSELAGLGVHVRVGEKATADIVRSEKFDVVIVATGAKSFVPDSIKADAGLVDARDLIAGKTGEPGQNCVVLGGGLIGVEAAVHLGWLGRHVTMLEMRDKIAADIEGGVLPSLLELVERYGIKAITGAVINEVADGSVMYEHEGQRHQIKADTVVSALGLKPDNALADELSGWGKVVVVGDASVPQKAIEAIRGGFLAGISI